MNGQNWMAKMRYGSRCYRT